MSRRTGRRMTADELLVLPDDGMFHELVRGELIEMSPAGGRHGEAGMHLGTLIGAHVHAHRLGRVFISDTGFVLARYPDTVRAPDVAFVAAEHLVERMRDTGFIEGPPDLAVEVRSPGDSPREVEEKVAEYLTAGCRLVWVIDPHRQTAAEYAPDTPVRAIDPDDALDGGRVVPGFRHPLRDAINWPV
jgi:Uma2 family endonuclease